MKEFLLSSSVDVDEDGGLRCSRNSLCSLSCPALPGKREVTTGFCSSKAFAHACGGLSEFYKLPQSVVYRLRPSPSYEV